MSISTSPETDVHGARIERYRPAARVLHWLTVVLLAVQFPVGLYMVNRGPGQNVWDVVTNTLYASHKSIGVIVLALAVTRIVYRVSVGAPVPAPSLPAWQSIVSRLNHWGLYALLLTVPSLGYLAVNYFPALVIVGPIALPAIVAPDRAIYARVIDWHAIGAGILAGLIALHVAAALFHRLIRRDEVLARMLPDSVRQSRGL